jgi:hypothetical protein
VYALPPEAIAAARAAMGNRPEHGG